MTDESDLIRAILLDPHDDGPRLRYADWLDDRGGCERAEFIRCQIEMEKMKAEYDHLSPLPKEHPAHDDWMKLVVRERELLGPHREGYYGENHYKWFVSHLHYEANLIITRGFPSSVTLPLAVFVGGECTTVPLYDDGYEYSHPDKCRKCHGTGRVPGIAKELFEKWPITEVRYSDAIIFQSPVISAACETPVDYGRRLAGLPPLTASSSPTPPPQ